MNKNKITAVLGPTNTGKTHLAIETMLSFDTGMIGFPLRLLAREVYDKVIKKTRYDEVALITGEEKIIPSNAKYFLCTVESMPIDKDLEFVGVDEIQMCADHERGHIFTDRLLNMRGSKLTMFMGSNTIKGIVSKLNDDIEFIDRKRLSKLTYSGHKKISRINRKTAIIAFSTEEVYAIAELIRRQKGGAAIVMGSLSPKTRNAQVELYQSGDVDFLVATDAIGMGINMDLDQVYFSNLKKFDIIEKARAIRYNSRFREEGTNVNFISLEDNQLHIRTYERGVEDETLACGTGVTAAVLAAHATGQFTGNQLDVKAQGGSLKVKFEQSGKGYENIWLEGPGEYVFKGTINV